MLILDNVSVALSKDTFLERKILNNISLSAEKGEFIVIVGGNGAGKSTMLNVISGVISPDCGKVIISGSDISNMPKNSRARLVSRVMQDPRVGVVENMTILENMTFALKRGGNRAFEFFSSKDRVDFFRDRLSILNNGLENRLDELVVNLSGGQRQSLSLLMATLAESEILLLDEITAALDPASSEAVMEFSNDIIRKQNLCCIMITHDMQQAINYGDRLLVLKNGEFVADYDKRAKSNLSIYELVKYF